MAFPAPRKVSIVFCGNSHTTNNDVPGMVKSLLESEGDLKVETRTFVGGFLNDIWQAGAVKQELGRAKYDVVVLQGAQLSSSHKFEYNNDGTIALARLAIAKGSRVLFFAEWPRRGWDESDFQLSHYRKYAKSAGGGEVVPVCRAWDKARKRRPSLDMWMGDGNHAKLEGSYLAALTLAQWMRGADAKLSWIPRGVPPSLGVFLRDIANDAVKDALESPSEAERLAG